MTEDMSMDALMANTPPVTEGEIMMARVVEARADGLLVDVGMKVESFIPIKEFGPHTRFQVGDEIPVLIKKGSGAGEQLQVSWRRARELQGWEQLSEAFSAQTPVTGKVSQKIKGGLVVDLGVECFLPASQVDYRIPQQMSEWIGREIQVLVIECNRQKGNVVLSRRRFLERERTLKKEVLLKELTVGEVRHGRVTGVTSFGAFVDIGGLEGLLHISDISWQHPARVEDALKVGDELDVKILKFDTATQRLSLGRKQLLPHPWEGLEQRFKVGQAVHGVVSSLVSFGAFIQLEPGIEGLVHVSEMSWNRRIHHPSEMLKPGQPVEAKVISINIAEQKMGLSLKRMGTSPWEEAARLYPVGTRLKAEVSRLASFGAFLKLPVGVEGLLRVQDLSWTKKIKHPSEVLKPGDVIEAVVLEASPQQERVSLGLKQLSADPIARIKIGQVVTGKVLSLVDFGAFVELESGLEALVRKSEMGETLETERREPAERRGQAHEGQSPKILTIGEIVTGAVTKIQKKERKIEISIRRHDRDEQRSLMKKYARPSTGPTLGDAMDWKNDPE